MKTIPNRLYLPEDQMPNKWYNLRADMMTKPAPILNPGTGKAVTLNDITPVFCDELAAQELDSETDFFDIPDEVQAFYKTCRPPL